MKTYRVVIQLNSADESIHEATLGQIRNIIASGEHIGVELVTHGGGANLLLTNSSFGNMITELAAAGVICIVCRNTLKSRHLQEEDFLPGTSFTDSAVVHLIKRQDEGWAYLKAG